MDSTSSESTPKIDTLLKERFGFSGFRAGQREAIEALLRGENTLCIQPTGHGKSLLYQLPALLLPGITLVISPLLALVRDQLGHLNNRFKIPAAAVNSDQSDEENAAAESLARSGKLKVLFVAPEQLDNLARFEFLQSLPIALLVVDEAHCISTWGHDFRPSYRSIVKLLRVVGAKQPLRVLGLTATANEETEADIRAQLESSSTVKLHVIRSSMDRPNIALAVVPLRGMAEKLLYLDSLLPRMPGCGLIYCATRENTETVAEYLSSHGIRAAAYHAGFEPERKRVLQAQFISGEHQVIVATNALGMGIDKQDLRYVIHADVPGSITAYYQEVGRAGRDGKAARGILLYDPSDRAIQEYFIHSAQPAPEDFTKLLAHAPEDGDPAGRPLPTITELKSKSGLHPTIVTVIIAELLEQEYLTKKQVDGRQVYRKTAKAGTLELVRYERQFVRRNAELTAMLDYASGKLPCLMQALRLKLGDGAAKPCEHCGACLKKASAVVLDATRLGEVQSWTEDRPVRIESSARSSLSDGVALLNAELNSKTFSAFMQSRSVESGQGVSGLSPDLEKRLEQRLLQISKVAQFGSVIVVPSRNWRWREKLGAHTAKMLGVPLFSEALAWRETPAALQGELLNNDQRRENVEKKMRWLGNRLPAGPILLLDDYTGSGATLKECARVIRQEACCDEPLVPLTVAKVKWRLGAKGMI